MASSLRNRLFSKSSESSTPPPTDSPGKAEDVKLAPVSEVVSEKGHHKKHKPHKRRSTSIFFLGGLFGIFVAGFFAKPSDLIEFPELGELSMDSILDVLPAGFVKDARDLAQGERDAVNYDSFSVGLN